VVDFNWPENITFIRELNEDNVLLCTPSAPPKEIIIQPFDSSSIIRVPQSKGRSVTFKLPNRTFRKWIVQFPLVSAFAITTDKSQGLTVEGCIIGEQKTIDRRSPPPQMLYVALSRAKYLIKMVITFFLTIEICRYFKPSETLLNIEKDLRSREIDEFE
jgi:hypothetical protein